MPPLSTYSLTKRADALRQVGEDERRERFSFALARTLDLGPEGLQQLLYTQVGAGMCCCLLGWAASRAAWGTGGARCGVGLLQRPLTFRTPLLLQSTAERLRAAEALILEGRNYLAARSTLRDSF